jgi:hypothetical protein
MKSLLGIDMFHLFAMIFFVFVLHILIYHPYGFGNLMEGFQQMGMASSHYENAHGSAPAGVHASPGEIQARQNSDSPHVNTANQHGNPQNTFPEYKVQPNAGW